MLWTGSDQSSDGDVLASLSVRFIPFNSLLFLSTPSVVCERVRACGRVRESGHPAKAR
jgi:hypothetical protein